MHDECPEFNPGAADFPAPSADDRTFVATNSTVNPMSIRFSVETTRYAGYTDGEGHLLAWQEKVNANVLERYAKVRFATCGIDCANGEECNDLNWVMINGVEVGQVFGGCSSCQESVFDVPIEVVEFPFGRGGSGNPPPSNTNEVEIEFAHGSDCRSGLYATIEIKCMSPVVLIHGNDSDGGFWERQGFTQGLNTCQLEWDNTIHLPEGRRGRNGQILAGLGDGTSIRAVATQWGVDSVHLAAHSKGGLDAREYLGEWYPVLDEREVRVLSLITISTPHDGSVGADLLVTKELQATTAAHVKFQGLPPLAELAMWLGAEYTEA
jgi:pimeloyl-ACP methyl ester carboxylesterase